VFRSINKWVGDWIDQVGHSLIIKKCGSKLVVDFYMDSKMTPASRDLLGNEKADSINMATYFEEQFLIVELGSEGLSPTLKLEQKRQDKKDILIPGVIMGLYDDYEDDFGVPWIFPLSLYKRRES
jgi:hypothetical protein